MKDNVIVVINFNSKQRGIFLPLAEEILLQKISKIVKQDDITYYSLDYFLNMVCRGDAIAIDMICCDIIYQKSTLWDYIKDNKDNLNKNFCNNLLLDIYKYIVYSEKN